MKKLCGIFGSIFILVLVTGCGEKSYTCTQERGNNKMSLTITTDIKDRVTNMKAVTSMVFDLEEELNNAYDSTKEECEKLEEKGIKCSLIKDNNMLTISIEGSSKYIDEDSSTWKKFKEKYEADGYTCK